MNTFYASVVQELEPKYREKPLIVTQVKSKNTAVIAASPEAKSFGIKTGMSVSSALKLCPNEVRAVATEFKWNEIFRDYHFKILDIVHSIVPADEVVPYSVDEMAWIPKKDSSRDYLIHTAELIRASFREKLGERITASIGIAPNVYLAKIASETDKRDGIVVFEGNYFEELLKLKLTDLPGINFGMKNILKKNGITSMEDLLLLGPKELKAAFGSVHGEKMFYKLRGDRRIDYQPPPMSNRSMGKNFVLPPEDKRTARVEDYVIELCQTLLQQLRDSDLATKSLTLGVVTKWRGEEEYFEGSIANDIPSNLEIVWLSKIRELFREMEIPKNVYISKIGIQAPVIFKLGNRTLFIGDAEKALYKKYEDAAEAVEALRKRGFVVNLAGANFSEKLIPYRIGFRAPKRPKEISN